MTRKRVSTPRVQLSPERRAALIKRVVDHSAAEFDEPLSAFRAETLLDLILRDAGASFYNQGVRDALAGVQAKAADLDAELAQPED